MLLACIAHCNCCVRYSLEQHIAARVAMWEPEMWEMPELDPLEMHELDAPEDSSTDSSNASSDGA